MNEDKDSFEEKITALNNTADTTAEYDEQDIQKNKLISIFAYFGILVLIPLLGAKDSKFARFHSNQGLILCVAAIVYYIINALLLSLHMVWLSMLLSLVGLVFLVWFIIGIINVVNGRAKELPLIGHFKLLKV